MFGRVTPATPSTALFHHVDGSGSGYELDDLMSLSPTAQHGKVIRPLLAIHDRYRCAEYPSGTNNPASFHDIRALAEKLEGNGL